ncbi:MAG: AAA family ATPase [Deltaproteobacteria bacterium]|nr:AAA family ATPase [Deltaproteobacteria bacterium]
MIPKGIFSHEELIARPYLSDALTAAFRSNPRGADEPEHEYRLRIRTYVEAVVAGDGWRAAREAATNTNVKGRPGGFVLPWKTPAELAADVPAEVPWIAKPWLAAGALTELDAKIKMGKTTLAMHLLRCIVDGAPFLGEPT